MQRSNKRDLARTARRNSFGGGLESLETRQMFSGVGANFYLVPVNHGASTQLVCDLTSPSETVTANSFYDGIQFFVNGQMANIFGNYSYLSIMAQSGNNTIVIDKNMTVPTCVWAGTGNDLLSTGANRVTLRAGGGDDTLVALGVNDKLFAGMGYTNIWSTGGNRYWQGAGTLVTHFIDSFLNTSDASLDGAPIAEPGTNTQSTFGGYWQNFSSQPLFSGAGPQISDIVQGACGDCYYLAGLAAIANVDPQQIRNNITALGDGTFAMEFYNNGTPVFVRVDGNLPVENYNLFYADFAGNWSTWAPLMEKGFAYFDSIENGSSPDYGVIDTGGFGDQALEALVGNAAQGTFNTSDGTDSMGMFGNNMTVFANWVAGELYQGKAVEMGFNTGNSNEEFSIPNVLMNGHEYTVVSYTSNNYGGVGGFWVRNPWGIDITDSNGTPQLAAPGHNDGTNDGMVWISVAEAWSVANDVGAVAA